MVQDSLLQLSQIGKAFSDRVVLRDLTFNVRRGEIISLIGPSGCGKTTILRLIAGLVEQDTGTITRASTLDRPGRLGYVFQDATLMPWASAEANVALPLLLQGLSRHQARGRAIAMLQMMALADFAQAAPHELSGGMKMRVALARALVTAPALLLMDEPFAALDEITRHALNEEMLRLVRTQDVSVVFVTHSVSEATYLSDRALVLSHRPGHIMAEYKMPWGNTRPAALRSSPSFMEETARVSAALGRAMNDSDEAAA